jgi:hypothetical protein
VKSKFLFVSVALVSVPLLASFFSSIIVHFDKFDQGNYALEQKQVSNGVTTTYNYEITPDFMYLSGGGVEGYFYKINEIPYVSAQISLLYPWNTERITVETFIEVQTELLPLNLEEVKNEWFDTEEETYILKSEFIDSFITYQNLSNAYKLSFVSSETELKFHFQFTNANDYYKYHSFGEITRVKPGFIQS